MNVSSKLWPIFFILKRRIDLNQLTEWVLSSLYFHDGLCKHNDVILFFFGLPMDEFIARVVEYSISLPHTEALHKDGIIRRHISKR